MNEKTTEGINDLRRDAYYEQDNCGIAADCGGAGGGTAGSSGRNGDHIVAVA